jgi:cytochrome c-type biogenesis protein
MDFSHIASQLGSNPAAAIPLLFVAGLLTSLTPCIYPMIPITAAIIGGQSAPSPTGEVPKRRPAVLALVYALGLALVYAALGLFAGLSGTIFGTVSSNPWLYFLQANVLLLAGLAMLNVWTVRLPTSVLQWASTAGTGGRLSGVFLMGAVSGLVAAPCSAPVMAAVLTWVTQTKSAFWGFIYLFVFSLGMCGLLVVIGASSGTLSRLPRAGVWMSTVKKLFGVILLGVAEYYLIKMGQVLI